MMKKATLFSILFAMLALIALIEAAPPTASNSIRIKQIFDRPYDLGLETVRLEGKVIKFIEGRALASRAYLFRDDWGDEIKIVTDRELPIVDRRYVVMGMVVVNNSDKETPEVIIIEKGRDGPLGVISPSYETQSNSGQNGTTAANKNRLVNVLFGLAAVILIIIAILAVFIISGKNKEGLTSAFSSTSFTSDSDSGLNGYPEPSSYIEDSSVKFAAPPDGTLKLLPGRLEITDGYDDHKNIKFFKQPRQEETEFTFGREPGTPYLHIQLKSPTVSAKQAKIMWTNGKYILINYSLTNPTVVDGKALAKDESVPLQEASKIEMGEIGFIFHEK